MDCPRCGTALDRYHLGDRVASECPGCGYLGVEADHRSEGAVAIESWDEALTRFRRRDSQRRLDPDARTALAALELPGTGAVRARRREAVGVLYDRLRRHEAATKTELLRGLDADDLGYASAETFWSSAARDALKAMPGVAAPDAGGSVWRYEG